MIKSLKQSISDINTKSKVYYIIMFLMLVITGVSAVITDGDSVTNFLFNHNDVFMDFFNSVNNCGADAYGEYGVIYPPFVVLFYKLLSKLFVPELPSITMKFTSLGMMMFTIYTILCVLFLVYCIIKFKSGNRADKVLFTFFTFTSLPMIFLLERGNVLLLVISLIMVFVFWHDSENAKLRHLSYICLAMAVAIKIYPVIFGLLLFRKKNNIKNILWCVFYGVLFFFVPFIFVGGFSQVIVLIQNILYTSSMFAGSGYGYKVNITNTFAFLGEVFNHEYIFTSLGNAVLIIFIIVGILLMMFGKFDSKWKIVTIASLFIVLVPGFSYIYSITYMIIPFVMFLNERKFKKLDFVYLILFILQFCVMPVFAPNLFSVLKYQEQSLNISTVIESFSLLIMTGIIYTEAIVNSLSSIKHKKLSSTRISLAPIVTVCIVLLAGVSVVFSVFYTPVKSGFSLTKLDPWLIAEDSEDDEKTVEELYSLIENEYKDEKLLIFPKTEFLKDIGSDSNEVSFYDISYYKNSLKTVKSIKNYNADVVVIYNVPRYDVVSTQRNISATELSTFYEMSKYINCYVWNNDYKKVETYTVNGDFSLTVWKKVDENETAKWNSGGKGSKTDPYTISSAEELFEFSEYVNAGHTLKGRYVELTNDIDMSGIKNFQPIGYEGLGNFFYGHFDGNGHAIENLKIKKKISAELNLKNGVGLFGNLGGTVSNLIVRNSSFKGFCIGVFARASVTEDAAIINCISENNRLKGYRCGEIVDDYAGKVISCLSLNNNSDGEAYQGLLGLPSSDVKIVFSFTNVAPTNKADAYVPDDIMQTKEFVKQLNDAAKEYNAEVKKADKTKMAARKKAGKKVKKIDNTLDFCTYKLSSGEITLSLK